MITVKPYFSHFLVISCTGAAAHMTLSMETINKAQLDMLKRQGYRVSFV